MKLKMIITGCFIISLLNSYAQSYTRVNKPQWRIPEFQLPTRWSKEVSPSKALPEYPRPQMVRQEWINLNGLWNYTITDSSTSNPDSFEGQILVPFPIESALSGVKKPLLPKQRLWYHRKINVPDLKGKRLILHFGAVDWQASVIINGKPVGEHTGGYNSFSFDITNMIKKGENELTVKVFDPTDTGPNPHGKQSLQPQGIMYTASSGIWQTVWLEMVPPVHIEDLHMTPDIDKGILNMQITTSGSIVNNDYTIAVSSPGLPTSKKQVLFSSQNAAKGNVTGLQLQVPKARLWSPEDPHLYDMTVQLIRKGKVIDEVKSYFGMRKIEIKKDNNGQERIFLNNQYTFNFGVLDQGFWPDGLYTAPTDAALQFDIESIKNMGFNTIRKHIKIEPARWYYHCDKLGMLVWQDMPYPGNLTVEGRETFEKENDITIYQLQHFPSIVCWVLFNEGWNRYDQKRLTERMQRRDSSRIINGHSGENYDRNAPRDEKLKWISSDLVDVHDYPGPEIPPSLPGKAKVLGEWGGVRVATPGHNWDPKKSWGYIESTPANFARKYEFMIKHLKLFEEEGLSASIYTQPFDVELEENGLVTYDREIFKIPVEKIKSINSMLFDKGTIKSP